MQEILKPPELTVDRVLFSNPHTCFVLPLVPAVGGVRFSKLSTPVLAHTIQRGHGGRYRMHPVGMPPGLGAWVFPVGTERGAPLRACDRNLIPCYARL